MTRSAMRIPAQFRPSHLLTTCQYRDGDCVLIAGDHAQPNPDNDATFGDHVYVIYREVDDGLPIDAYTEPVASCTSMAVARTLVHQEGIGCGTIQRTPRNAMPAAASRRITERDIMLAHPVIREMLEQRRAKAAKRGRKQASHPTRFQRQRAHRKVAT